MLAWGKERPGHSRSDRRTDVPRFKGTMRAVTCEVERVPVQGRPSARSEAETEDLIAPMSVHAARSLRYDERVQTFHVARHRAGSGLSLSPEWRPSGVGRLRKAKYAGEGIYRISRTAVLTRLPRVTIGDVANSRPAANSATR